jgi:hypothetical protein
MILPASLDGSTNNPVTIFDCRLINSAVIRNNAATVDNLNVLVSSLPSSCFARIAAMLAKTGSSLREDIPTSKRHQLFEKYIQPSLVEINASIAAIRAKHDEGNEDTNTLRLSTVAALLRITAELINLQSKIVTGLLVEPSREAGNIINKMVNQSEINDVVKCLSGWIVDMIKLVIEMPVSLETKKIRKKKMKRIETKKRKGKDNNKEKKNKKKIKKKK